MRMWLVGYASKATELVSVRTQMADSETRTPNGHGTVPWCFSGNMRHLTLVLSQLILQQLCRISVTMHTWKWRKQASERFRDLPMDTKQEMMLLGFEPGLSESEVQANPLCGFWQWVSCLSRIKADHGQSLGAHIPKSHGTWDHFLVRHCLSYLHLSSYRENMKRVIQQVPGWTLSSILMWTQIRNSLSTCFPVWNVFEHLWSLSHEGRY